MSESTDDARGTGTDEDATPVQPDLLTGTSPDVDEVAANDPDREGDEADPYRLRSGIETSPSDDDPGSMLNR